MSLLWGGKRERGGGGGGETQGTGVPQEEK